MEGEWILSKLVRMIRGCKKDDKVRKKKIQPQYDKGKDAKRGIVQSTGWRIKITKENTIINPKSLKMKKGSLVKPAVEEGGAIKEPKKNITKDEHLMKRKIKNIRKTVKGFCFGEKN